VWPNAWPDAPRDAQVRSKLAMLNKQWPVAENLLLSQGKVEECIAMYQDIHRCVRVCVYVCVCA